MTGRFHLFPRFVERNHRETKRFFHGIIRRKDDAVVSGSLVHRRLTNPKNVNKNGNNFHTRGEEGTIRGVPGKTFQNKFAKRGKIFVAKKCMQLKTSWAFGTPAKSSSGIFVVLKPNRLSSSLESLAFLVTVGETGTSASTLAVFFRISVICFSEASLSM